MRDELRRGSRRLRQRLEDKDLCEIHHEHNYSFPRNLVNQDKERKQATRHYQSSVPCPIFDPTICICIICP